MNKQEALSVAEEVLSELRRLPYDRLTELSEAQVQQRTGSSGQVYQVEISSFIDDRRRNTLRVVVAVDDTGWSAYLPITRDFILSPDGTFVGEGES